MNNDEKSIAQTAQDLRDGVVTSVALTQSLIRKIEETNQYTHAFNQFNPQAALEEAQQADLEISAGKTRSLLHGIPYGVKDIYDIKGLPTTCHSKLRLEHVAQEDATAVRKMRDAGAIVLGKLATHEFALGGPSFDLPYPPARNPWDLAHIPGGSSSGSGSAIAAGYTRLALGTCTGGSIRIPAAWCGTVGLKPTYGRVSKYGVYPLAWSLDHCGPLARSVDDAAIALQVLAGFDPQDPNSANVPVSDYRANLDKGVQGLKIGVPKKLFQGHPLLNADCGKAIDNTIEQLRQAGALVEEIDFPAGELFLACGRVINTAEMYTIHAPDLRKRPLDYGELTLPRLALGATVSAEDYINAQRVRRRLSEEVERIFEKFDVILTAVTLDTAPKFNPTPHFRSWPVQTYAFNVTGHPAISVPVGLAQNGLPMAVQVVGKYFDEAGILQVARAIEKLSGWEQVPLPVLN